MDLPSFDLGLISEHFNAKQAISASVVMIIGFVLATVFSRVVHRFFTRRTSTHLAVLLKRIVYYTILFFTLLNILDTLGFEQNAFLGVLGVLSLAFGFAARTPIANMITHLFLIVERPFVIGDYLEIGEMVGEVISIELLAVKIRTRDNVMVRFPNEQLVSASFTNLTRFPIRRFDMPIRIDYYTDIDLVKKILLQVANDNPLSLETPQPNWLFVEFAESCIIYKFCVWAKISSYLELKTQLPAEIQQAFIKHGIKIPYSKQRVGLEQQQ